MPWKAEDILVSKAVVGPLKENAWLVGSRCSGEAAAIDPGDEPDRIIALARRDGLSIRRILLTHAHLDHLGGAAALARATGAGVYLHKADVFWFSAIAEQSVMTGQRVSEAPEPAGFLDDGDKVSLEGLAIGVLHVPGHSPGHLAFAIPGHVFVGDCLFGNSIGITDIPGGNLEQLLASIRARLLALPGETIVHPGHGPDTTIAREKRSNPFLK